MTPDYGTPGAPNLDPYYVSDGEAKRIEAERRERIAEIIKDTGEKISAMLEDMERELIEEGASLVSMTLDVGNLGVSIEVKP